MNERTNERTTEEKLISVLNNGYALTERKVLTIKKILLDSGRNEFNLRDLINLDKTKYKNKYYKSNYFYKAFKKMGFKIIKRQKSFLRKRIKTNVLNSLPDYRIKTFWLIQINQNGQ